VKVSYTVIQSHIVMYGKFINFNNNYFKSHTWNDFWLISSIKKKIYTDSREIELLNKT